MKKSIKFFIRLIALILLQLWWFNLIFPNRLYIIAPLGIGIGMSMANIYNQLVEENYDE